MSKRKRDVAFLKPAEPAFISRMKAEAGYKEGDTVDTKRQVAAFDDEDSDDHDDEQPQVVVLSEGDLTAEEVSKAKKEKEEGPADLNQRVVFRKPEKAKKDSPGQIKVEEEDSKETKAKEIITEKVKSKTKPEGSKRAKSKSVLSFNEDEEAEEA